MAAILLTWNPAVWDFGAPGQVSYDQVLAAIAADGHYDQRWSVGHRRHVDVGTEVWLLRQGREDRGLVGHGVAASGVYRAEHYATPGATSSYVDVAWDCLLPLENVVPIEEVLVPRVPGVHWTPQASGNSIASADEAALRSVWAEHVQTPADPTTVVPGTYPLEALSSVSVNRYERDSQGRQTCLDANGTSCGACGFSFGAFYGELGAGFIHVHHIVPVSQLGPDYQFDPSTDLVPLCPNCHAMAHMGRPDPYTPIELQQIIAGARTVRGELVSPAQEQALEEATRILGPAQE